MTDALFDLYYLKMDDCFSFPIVYLQLAPSSVLA